MLLISHSMQGWLDQIGALTTSCNRLIFTVTPAVTVFSADTILNEESPNLFILTKRPS